MLPELALRRSACEPDLLCRLNDDGLRRLAETPLLRPEAERLLRFEPERTAGRVIDAEPREVSEGLTRFGEGLRRDALDPVGLLRAGGLLCRIRGLDLVETAGRLDRLLDAELRPMLRLGALFTERLPELIGGRDADALERLGPIRDGELLRPIRGDDLGDGDERRDGALIRDRCDAPPPDRDGRLIRALERPPPPLEPRLGGRAAKASAARNRRATAAANKRITRFVRGSDFMVMPSL